MYVEPPDWFAIETERQWNWWSVQQSARDMEREISRVTPAASSGDRGSGPGERDAADGGGSAGEGAGGGGVGGD
jgi:hypothetical protein